MAIFYQIAVGDGEKEYGNAYNDLTTKIDESLKEYYTSRGIDVKSVSTYMGPSEMIFSLKGDALFEINPNLGKYLPDKLLDCTDQSFDTITKGIPMIAELLRDYRHAGWEVRLARSVNPTGDTIPSALIFSPKIK